MNYIVYVLKSEKDGSRYVGFTQDLAFRLKEHNRERNVSTRNKGPWRVLYSEVFPTRLLAQKREKFFKSGRGKAVLNNLLMTNIQTSGRSAAW